MVKSLGRHYQSCSHTSHSVHKFQGGQDFGCPTLPASNEAQLKYRAPDTPLERQCLPRVLPHSPGLVTDFFAWRAAEKEGEKTNFTSLNTNDLINVITSSNNILKHSEGWPIHLFHTRYSFQRLYKMQLQSLTSSLVVSGQFCQVCTILRDKN